MNDDRGNYWITTRAGDRLRSAEHFEVALAEMKDTPLAAMVVRASDGVILSFKTTPKRKQKRGMA